jgi:hypothetical protein
MTKKKTREWTGNDLHIEYDTPIGTKFQIKELVILSPVTPISIYTDNENFEWEGLHNKEAIRIVLPRRESENKAQIIGGFPIKYDSELGTTENQLYKELRRVLRQLD